MARKELTKRPLHKKGVIVRNCKHDITKQPKPCLKLYFFALKSTFQIKKENKELT